MTFKKTLLSFCAVALALGIALAGIWYNCQHLALQNGGVLTAEAASSGVFLTGWEETSPGGWKFSFTAAPEVGELILYQASSTGFLAEEPLTSRDHHPLGQQLPHPSKLGRQPPGGHARLPFPHDPAMDGADRVFHHRGGGPCALLL